MCQQGGYFTNLTLPEAEPQYQCVKTCSTFQDIKGMQKSASQTEVLANNTVEYSCRNPKKIPETGANLKVLCDFNSQLDVSSKRVEF